MKFKKTTKIVIVIAVALITSTTFAQQRGGGQGGRGGGNEQGPPPIPSEKQIKKMVSDLSEEIFLKEEQEGEILALYTAHFEELRAKTKSGKPDRNEMEKFESEFENKVKALLTEEQQEAYTTYMKNNGPKNGRKPKK